MNGVCFSFFFCYREPYGNSCSEFFTTSAFHHQFLPSEPRSGRLVCRCVLRVPEYLHISRIQVSVTCELKEAQAKMSPPPFSSGTRRSINVFTVTCHWTLPCATLIHCHILTYFHMHLNFILSFVSRSSK